MSLTTNPARIAAEQDYNPLLVAVDFEAIKALAVPDGLKGMGTTLEGPLANDPSLFVPYFIAMDAMNYQFWSVDKAKGFVRYGRNGKVGALAMQEGFHAAWLECFNSVVAEGSLERSVATAALLRERVQREGVAFIFGDIPAAKSRQELLLEVLEPGRLGRISTLLLSRAHLTGTLGWDAAQLLADNFPRAYADRYLKKAQLTLMFIAGQWGATGQGSLELKDLSAAADYQLPKVLRSLSLLCYSPEVAALIDSGQLIASGSALELAIRAATILACDALAKHFGCPSRRSTSGSG